MKKIIISLVVLLGFTSAYATGSSGSSGYNSPILDNSLNFSATLDGSKVYTSWSAYNKDEGFVYYKVVRSQNNANPVYPEDSYIKYTTDVNETAYTDASPLYGTSYYRVCAITSEKNRYCSNVVTISREKIEEKKIGGEKDAYGCYISAGYSWCEAKSKCIRSWEEKCVNADIACTNEYSPVCGKKDGVQLTYGNKCNLKAANATYLYSGECKTEDTGDISYTLKEKTDKLVKSFIEKVEKKYNTTEKRISVLNAVVEKLNALAEAKPTQKNLINYIVMKIKNKIESYKGNDLGDIEGIFNDLQ